MDRGKDFLVPRIDDVVLAFVADEILQRCPVRLVELGAQMWIPVGRRDSSVIPRDRGCRHDIQLADAVATSGQCSTVGLGDASDAARTRADARRAERVKE